MPKQRRRSILQTHPIPPPAKRPRRRRALAAHSNSPKFGSIDADPVAASFLAVPTTKLSNYLEAARHIPIKQMDVLVSKRLSAAAKRNQSLYIAVQISAPFHTKRNGAVYDNRYAPSRDVAEQVENLMPIMRLPCQPLCPLQFVYIGETHRHIEARNGSRMDAVGEVWGDEQFQILYEFAIRNECRYNHASKEMQLAADKAKCAGVLYTLDDAAPFITVTDGKGDKITVANIKAATKGQDNIVGILHCPLYGTNMIFNLVNDLCWHRHMLPFGCYFYEVTTCHNRAWQDWNAGLISPAGFPHMRITWSPAVAGRRPSPIRTALHTSTCCTSW